ncbi:MAG: DUF4236 domain-containing protein [bacterium]
MGFRFWRRMKIAPGITLNLSKAGGSLSFGGRGGHYTVGSRGTRKTVGIPGTGLFYTTTGSLGSSSKSSGKKSAPAPKVPARDRLSMGFFKRLFTPQEEEDLVDGCREVIRGNDEQALSRLSNCLQLADGAYLYGVTSLKLGRTEDAEPALVNAFRKRKQLGRYFSKYGISPTASVPVTDEVTAHVGPGAAGVLLCLVEIYQEKQNWQEAKNCLDRLARIAPDDVVVKLSRAELLLDKSPRDKKTCDKVIRLCEGLNNESPVHTALFLYKARALRNLGLPEAARDTLTKTMRRKKNRSPELIKALRYERMLAYEDLGHTGRARKELEKLYSQDPDYEDVAERLFKE